MKATDELHKLLHSLSQAEKRYVRIFASKHLKEDGNSNYLILLDAILEQEEYDEEALKTRLKKNKALVRNLPSEKNYLYRFVMKSMRTFHSEKNVEKQLKEALLDIRFLRDKRLYNLANKEMEKAKKLAYQFEKYLVVLELLHLERHIIIERYAKDLHSKIQSINQETREVLVRYGKFMEMTYLENDIFLISRTRNLVRDEAQKDFLKSVEKSQLLLEEPTEDSFELQRLYHSSKCNFYRAFGEFEQAYDHQKKLIELWEANPPRIRENSLSYKKYLSNYLNNCNSLGRFEEFPPILEKIRSIPCQSLEEEAEEFQNVYYMELLYRMNTDRFETAVALLPEIERGLKKYRTKINKARELAFYHNISVMLFLQHNYKEALNWVNRIINDGKSDVRQDIQSLARLFMLILHFELGKHDLLEYEFRQVQRYLKQHNSLFHFETALLQQLQKLVGASPRMQLELFEHFAEKLKTMQSDPQQGKSPGLQEVSCWARSHASQRPMIEILKTGS